MSLDDALTLDEIAERVAVEDFSFLQPLELGTGDLPKLELTADQLEEVRYGRFITLEDAGLELAAFYEGKLVAILEKKDQSYKPKKVFL